MCRALAQVVATGGVRVPPVENALDALRVQTKDCTMEPQNHSSNRQG